MNILPAQTRNISGVTGSPQLRLGENQSRLSISQPVLDISQSALNVASPRIPISEFNVARATLQTSEGIPFTLAKNPEDISDTCVYMSKFVPFNTSVSENDIKALGLKIRDLCYNNEQSRYFDKPLLDL